MHLHQVVKIPISIHANRMGFIIWVQGLEFRIWVQGLECSILIQGLESRFKIRFFQRLLAYAVSIPHLLCPCCSDMWREKHYARSLFAYESSQIKLIIRIGFHALLSSELTCSSLLKRIMLLSAITETSIAGLHYLSE